MTREQAVAVGKELLPHTLTFWGILVFVAAYTVLFGGGEALAAVSPVIGLCMPAANGPGHGAAFHRRNAASSLCRDEGFGTAFPPESLAGDRGECRRGGRDPSAHRGAVGAAHRRCFSAGAGGGRERTGWPLRRNVKKKSKFNGTPCRNL